MTNPNVNILISRMIAILKTTTEEYNVVNNDTSLQEAFHEAGRGLLLIEEALQTVESQLDGRGLAGDSQSAIVSLEACNAKVKLSESIFKDVARAPETSRFECYKAAVQQQGKGRTVEVLILGMMNDICELAENDTVKATTKDQVKRLHDAIDRLSTIESSVLNDGRGDIFNSYGSGNQFNAPGGTQNNNTGSGNQFPSATFTGTVNFGKVS